MVIAVGITCWFGRPLFPFLKAAQEGVSTEQAALLIGSLEQSGGAGGKLAAAALEHSGTTVAFDASYYKINYPNGDVAPGKGAAADVIIRCYRKLGIDLQKEVHEDMMEHFRKYPQLWGALVTDTNIDHRRVANLQRFFERKGQTLTPSRNPADYHPGEIVVWELANGDKHIGIVVPGPDNHTPETNPGNRAGEAWVVHSLAAGVKWESALFDYKIVGHFSYPATQSE